MTKLTTASNSLATSKWRWWTRTPLARARMDDDALGQTSASDEVVLFKAGWIIVDVRIYKIICHLFFV